MNFRLQQDLTSQLQKSIFLNFKCVGLFCKTWLKIRTCSGLARSQKQLLSVKLTQRSGFNERFETRRDETSSNKTKPRSVRFHTSTSFDMRQRQKDNDIGISRAGTGPKFLNL